MVGGGGGKGEPLADEKQCAVRADLGELMTIDRIAMRDALYYASVSALNLAKRKSNRY